MNNYEHYRYQDKFLKTDNLKYTIARKEDIEDIKNLIDYIEGLVIKDYDESMLYETLETSRASSLYINCYLGVDNKLTEFEKQTVIKSYEEKNKYYIDLKMNYNIDWVDARLAKDYTILKATNKSLSYKDELLFTECYNLTLTYFINVLKNDAFVGEKLNKCYFRELLVYFAMQKWITKKMEKYWDPDSYSKYDCKNTFISTGIDYFDGLPLQYQRRLIKMTNTIIQYKGTDRCFDVILDAFGMENVQIYKYVLAKDKDDLFFYKTKINDAVNTRTDNIVSYDEIVGGDALWQAEKSEILEKDFNTVDTKYITVDLATDIIGSTMSMAYLMSLIYILENNYKHVKNEEDFTFSNKNISSRPVDIFDAIIAVIALVCKRKGYSTEINKNMFSKELKSIYGFDNTANNDNVRDLLHDIKLMLIQNKYELELADSYQELYDFFSSFTMEGFEVKGLYSEEELKKDFRGDPIYYDELVRLTNFYKLVNLQNKIDEYGKNIIFRLTDVLFFLSERILVGKPDIVNFKKYFPNMYKLIGKYNIFYQREGVSETYNLERALENDPLMKVDMDNLVLNQKSDELKDAYSEGNIAKVFEMLKVIIEKRRQELFSTLSIENVREELKRDPSDILFYDRLNSYFEIYTDFNVNKEKFYNLEDFLYILDYNNNLRLKLEQYIMETDNYQLYKRYNDLWADKFMVAQNVDIFGSHVTYDDYLKAEDINLYNYIQIPKSIIDDDAKTKTWFDNTIYELCESLDTFVNDPDHNHFIENSFIGISEFIRRYIMVAIVVFKAYTIDLLGNNFTLKYHDPVFNAIRLFDEIYSMSVSDVMVENLYIEDLFGITSRELMGDYAPINDEVFIHVINYQFEYEQLPSGEIVAVPIKDKDGNYVQASDTVVQKIESNSLTGEVKWTNSPT